MVSISDQTDMMFNNSTKTVDNEFISYKYVCENEFYKMWKKIKSKWFSFGKHFIKMENEKKMKKG